LFDITKIMKITTDNQNIYYKKLYVNILKLFNKIHLKQKHFIQLIYRSLLLKTKTKQKVFRLFTPIFLNCEA
jgi:hypothetical protein